MSWITTWITHGWDEWRISECDQPWVTNNGLHQVMPYMGVPGVTGAWKTGIIYTYKLYYIHSAGPENYFMITLFGE
jgi:hypothetical protein